MATISIQDLQQNPAALLDRVAAGERMIISRDGRSVAEILPIAASAPHPRPFGLAAGEFILPDDFNAPLPEETLRAFEGQ